MKVIITGAGGYIGRHLAEALAAKGHVVTALLRQSPGRAPFSPSIRVEAVGSYHDLSWDGSRIFEGQDVVIHTAARVHYRKKSADPLSLYRNDNIDFSMHMAEQARRAGAKRFIFISSVGAQLLEDRFHEGRITAKQAWEEHPYRMSKLEAERKLLKFGREGTPSVICVRLPMVYGRGAPGSFSTLIRLLEKGVPLPFGSLLSPRAFASIETVQDFVAHCVAHPKAEQGVWSIRDGDEAAPIDFAAKIATAAHLHAPRPVNCPAWLLKLVAGLFGYEQTARSLTESLHIDLGPVERKLGWRPSLTIAEGLRKAFA